MADARIRLALDGVQTVVGGLNQVGARIGSVVNSISALTAIGGTLSAAAFAGWIKGAIDAGDAANKLKQMTGVAVKDLAGIQLAYDQAGLGTDVFTKSMSKLSKGMVDGNKTLEQLGIKTKDASGNFKSTKDVLYETADAFAAMDDGALKTNMAIELFEKSGAQMVPLLNGGSEGLRAMDEMAQKLGLTLSDKTAAEAENFNDTLDLVQLGGQGVARGIAAELLPTLSSLAGSFLESMTTGDKLKKTADILAAGLKMLYSVAVGIVEVFSTVGKTIGAAGAQIVAVMSGDFKAAAQIGREWQADIGASWAETGKSISAAWSASGNETVDAMLKIQKTSKALHASADEIKKQTAAANKETESQAKLMAELSGVTASYMEDLTRLQVVRTKQNLTDEQYVALVTELIAKQPGAKKVMDEHAKSIEAANKVKEAANKLDTATYESLTKETVAVQDQVKAMERQVETYGLAESAVVSLDLAKAKARLAAGPASYAELIALDAQIAALEKLGKLASTKESLDATKKANVESVKDYESTVKKYGDLFSNGFADMINNGKAGWKSFTKSLTTTFKTSVADQIYKMFAQPFVVKMVASLIGIIGGGMLPGSAQAGTGNVASIAQSASSIYNTVTGGFTAIGDAVASGVAYMQTLAGSTYGTAIGSQQSMMLAAQESGMGATTPLSGYAGTAATYLAGAAVGVYGGRAISDGYAVGGGSGNTAVNVGTAIGAIWGPLGAALGGLIGGLVNRTFGMAEKKTILGMEGNITSSATTGNNFSAWTQEGGLLRSDKSGTNPATPLSTDIANTMSAGLAQMKVATSAFAKALGLDASLIAGYEKSFRIELSATDLAANSKVIEGLFLIIGDELANRLVPNLKDFARQGESAAVTLNRISNEFAVVDAVLGTIGSTSENAFGAAGLASLKAREQLITAAGGIDRLAAGTAFFAQTFQTEAERLAPVQKQVTEQMSALGYAGVTTRDQFKQAVLGLFESGALATESGAATFAGLMSVQEAFALVHPVLEATAAAGRATSDILSERLDLQKQLDQLTLTSVELLAQQRAALDDSNRSLFDQVQAAQAAKIASDAAAVAAKDAIDAATQAAKTAADALTSTNNGYQQQIDALVKASLPLAQQRALEVAGMDASTLALYERLEALRGDTAASAARAALMESNQARADAAYAKSVSDRQAQDSAAASLAASLLNQRAGMEITLYNLTHTAAEQAAAQRQRELAGMDATLRPLQSQIFAMQDQASAAAQAATALENAAASARAIGGERVGLQREMFQLQGDTNALRQLEIAALDPSNRALKESIFALQDKMAADQAAAQAQAAAAAMAQQIAQAQAQAQAQAAEEQRRAAEEQVRAAEQLKSAWGSVTDTIFDEVARIRGLISGGGVGSLSAAQTKFAIATAQARAGDMDVTKMLPQLSQTMLQLAETNAVTAFDLRLIRAQTASSLQMTAGLLGKQFGLAVPSYDVGTDSVPQTGLALIHKGEKITPAAYNNPYTPPGDSGASSVQLVAEIRSLRQENREIARRLDAALYAIAKNTGETAGVLESAVNGDVPVLVRVAP